MIKDLEILESQLREISGTVARLKAAHGGERRIVEIPGFGWVVTGPGAHVRAATLNEVSSLDLPVANAYATAEAIIRYPGANTSATAEAIIPDHGANTSTSTIVLRESPFPGRSYGGDE
jgi:hypothetical protein